MHGLAISLMFSMAIGLRVNPVYPLAHQTVWNAAVPIPVNVNFDVPHSLSVEQKLLTSFALHPPLEDQREATSFALAPIVDPPTTVKFRREIQFHVPDPPASEALSMVHTVRDLYLEKRKTLLNDKLYADLLEAAQESVKGTVLATLRPLMSLRNPMAG